MSRNISSGNLAELAKDRNQPVHLFELYLDGAPTFATDSYRTIEWGGNTYAADGDFLTYDGLEETSDLSVSQVRCVLSGVDQTLISKFLQHEYLDRRLVIRKGFFDENEQLILDPIPIFDGRCDAPSINEDPDQGICTISVTASSQWIDFERKPGRHTNHEEQQLYFPGDLGFEYISQLNKEIKWGGR